LTFVATDGRVVHLPKVSKGGKIKSKQSSSRRGGMFNIKKNRVLFVFDELELKTKTPKISLLTHYNGQRIWH
jgi:hypothetical protein